jgi:RecB family endonuclease NucS
VPPTMIIPIKTDANITVDEMDITETSFKSLNLKESHIEEFIRTNIELLLTDESLLIIGSQVTNSEKGRSDLTAIDENGNLVLIEIKRDVEDIKARKEELEFQAIRYAAAMQKSKHWKNWWKRYLPHMLRGILMNLILAV